MIPTLSGCHEAVSFALFLPSREFVQIRACLELPAPQEGSVDLGFRSPRGPGSAPDWGWAFPVPRVAPLGSSTTQELRGRVRQIPVFQKFTGH